MSIPQCWSAPGTLLACASTDAPASLLSDFVSDRGGAAAGAAVVEESDAVCADCACVAGGCASADCVEAAGWASFGNACAAGAAVCASTPDANTVMQQTPTATRTLPQNPRLIYASRVTLATNAPQQVTLSPSPTSHSAPHAKILKTPRVPQNFTVRRCGNSFIAPAHSTCIVA